MHTGARFAILLVCFSGCARSDDHEQQRLGAPDRQTVELDAKIETDGLHNIFRISDKLLSGSSPEEDAGFLSLQSLGVKTIISVDGSQPDLERAHKYGMRYVHLPIGYDGVPREQALKIAKAIRDLPGPVYLHCHHGQHRGPASAAVAHLLLDPNCTVEQAIMEMKRAGTDPRYKGLYAAPLNIRAAPAPDLDLVAADFPETAKPAALAEIMVHVDEHWDAIKLTKGAGWAIPKGHPDVSPPHEALMLAEQFREAGRMPAVQARPEDFRTWLHAGETEAEKMETILQAGKTGHLDTAAADKAFREVNATCLRCHAKYRDVPQDAPSR
ncbi:MAG TPA: hypothetical protein VGP68_00865 [Gemmataceae bacterium]|jgi:protein tyrosine phosphatase (PTP) superfamily phosphohydrolase (DUF442 family)|nr:hypothetical protein [Gemmataceae bacterium]